MTANGCILQNANRLEPADQSIIKTNRELQAGMQIEEFGKYFYFFYKRGRQRRCGFIFWRQGLLSTCCSPSTCLEMESSRYTYDMEREKVRQRYKCLPPAHFVPEPRNCYGCEIFILIRRSSECRFAVAQTSQTPHQSLMIYTSRPTHFPCWSQPPFKVI